MWLKLGIVSIVTAALIFFVIPIRTRAILVDPTNQPLSTKWSLSFVVSNMYLTPGTVVLIGAILAAACYIGFRIVRNS